MKVLLIKSMMERLWNWRKRMEKVSYFSWTLFFFTGSQFATISFSCSHFCCCLTKSFNYFPVKLDICQELMLCESSLPCYFDARKRLDIVCRLDDHQCPCGWWRCRIADQFPNLLFSSICSGGVEIVELAVREGKKINNSSIIIGECDRLEQKKYWIRIVKFTYNSIDFSNILIKGIHHGFIVSMMWICKKWTISMSKPK